VENLIQSQNNEQIGLYCFWRLLNRIVFFFGNTSCHFEGKQYTVVLEFTCTQLTINENVFTTDPAECEKSKNFLCSPKKGKITY
jgi:hypothetical protein